MLLSRDIEPLLVQCLASVVDGGPALKQQWLNVSLSVYAAITTAHNTSDNPAAAGSNPDQTNTKPTLDQH